MDKRKSNAVKTTAKEREELFVSAYLANGKNATQACITVGFSPKGARVQGARMLAKPNVVTLLKQARDKEIEKHGVTRETLLADIQYAKDKAKDSLETDYPQYQHFLKSVEMQAKMLGLNEPDKIELSGEVLLETEPSF